jgi:hypothetical protein
MVGPKLNELWWVIKWKGSKVLGRLCARRIVGDPV